WSDVRSPSCCSLHGSQNGADHAGSCRDQAQPGPARPRTAATLETMEPRRALGAFLRSRRDRTQPQDVGVAARGGRRVPGLRREEVALLAGVSADYLRRVEQGRVLPSVELLDALADALRLGAADRLHLEALADQARG